MPYDPNSNYTEEKRFPELLRIGFIIVSVSLLFVSCFYICYCTIHGCTKSIDVLLFGWLGLFGGGANLTWTANPLLIITWILFSKRHRLSLFFSILATLISLSFLGFNQIQEGESGGSTAIIKIGPGYWFWFSSCLTTFLGNLTLIIYKFRHS
jgi:hypothetical protein